MSRCTCVCWVCGLLALLMFCLAAHGQATQPATAEAERWTEFDGGASGFRLRFPSGTMKRMDVQGAELALLRQKHDPGGTQAQVFVLCPPNITGGLDLEKTASAYVENFKRAMSDAKVLETKDTTLDGAPARSYLIQGHQVQNGRDSKARMILAVRNDRLFSLVAMAEPEAFDSLEQTFEEMVKTFTWTK